MAGRGPAPKATGRRRRGALPSRGEWQLIPPESDIEVPDMPEHPKGGPWLSSSERHWAGWWHDGASTTWTSADVVALEVVLLLTDDIGRGELKYAAELRLRLDGLRLSQKGKRDLRFQVTAPVDPEPATGPASMDDYRAAAAAAHDSARSSLDKRRAILRAEGVQRISAEERYGSLGAVDTPGSN
jgi:hypothetical protein